jgi:ribosome biogenesis GTPase
MSPLPLFSHYLVNRYLIAANILNLKTVLLINKADLLEEADQEKAKQCLSVYQPICDGGFLSSIYQVEGLKELTDYLQNKTAVLVGPSGVGKSSIISKLSVDSDIAVKAVSAKGIGKHTTTATRLYHLPNGGKLIDSPGVREFNLWPVSPQTIVNSFKEFKEFASGCKFRDCTHLSEPGCRVIEAKDTGEISQERYDNYVLLLKENKTLSAAQTQQRNPKKKSHDKDNER